MNTRSNFYEEQVDAIMIDLVSEADGELKAKLEDISENNKQMKRTAIMSILDSDRGLFKKIAEWRTKTHPSKTEYMSQSVKMLREYVQVADTEVKSHGEVMTPIWLVEEMLDTLPKEVWSNPNLKWLDPCSGVGIFQAVAVNRLMKGLEGQFKNVGETYKHIVENMMHVGELQAKNLFLYQYAFDPMDVYDLNVYNGSYLDESFDKHKKEVWGVDKFDIVMQNPPYQWKRKNETKSHKLWNKFILKTIDNDLKKDGYLIAVHPSGWKNFGGQFRDVQEEILKRELQYLNINNYKKGFETFGAKTDYDFYCLKNTFNTNIKTKVIDIDEVEIKINLTDKLFIPKCNLERVYSLVAKGNDGKVEMIANSMYHHQRPHMNKTQTDEFKYICLQNISTKNEISCVWYSNINTKGHFNIPKVVFGRRGAGVFIDDLGIYGLAEDCGGIVDTSRNLENISKALQSEDFIKNIMGFRESLGDKYNRKIIATFRKDFWKEFI